MQVEIDPRSLKEDLITDSPWRWSGALVVCRWCRGIWNHAEECSWLATRHLERDSAGG
jgi:hypothetical protein